MHLPEHPVPVLTLGVVCAAQVRFAGLIAPMGTQTLELYARVGRQGNPTAHGISFAVVGPVRVDTSTEAASATNRACLGTSTH